MRLSRAIASRTAREILLRFRLRHVYGDDAHSFALSLIAYLCDLRQIGLGSFGADGPEVNECRMALCLPRCDAASSATRWPAQMTATVGQPSSLRALLRYQLVLICGGFKSVCITTQYCSVFSFNAANCSAVASGRFDVELRVDVLETNRHLF